MFDKYDITFCSDKECKHTECKRHHSHIPIGIPVSVFMGPTAPKDDKECPYYYPDRLK